MTLLRRKQIEFSHSHTKLRLFIENIARYSYVDGELWRSKEECERLFKVGFGSKNSVHNLRLAWDGILVDRITGLPITDIEAYRPIGEYWKSLSHDDVIYRWGGDFKSLDRYHFSIEHNGVR